jgi:hypothetical protein
VGICGDVRICGFVCLLMDVFVDLITFEVSIMIKGFALMGG